MDLTNWRGRAKGLLDRFKTPHDRDDAVIADRFDRAMYDEMIEAAAPLRRAIEDVDADMDTMGIAEDLMRDVFLALWKDDPQLRDSYQMADGHRLNRGIIAELMRTPEWERLRRQTRHDKYVSTLAASSLSKQLGEIAKENAERRRQDMERLKQARDAAREAAEHLLNTPDDELTEDDLEAFDEAVDEFDVVSGPGCTPTVRGSNPAAAIDDAQDDAAKSAAQLKSWGVDPGEVQYMSFEERAALAAALSGHRLAQFHALIGRMRMMAVAQKAHKVVEARDDIVDVSLSNDLTRVLMSEFVAAQAHPALMLDLQRRFAEGQLLSREYEGTESVGHGPIVCCIDTSGSMSATAGSFDGVPVTREAWAKAAALALLDESVRLRRNYLGVNFASAHQVESFQVLNGRYDRAEMLQWTAKFFNGGTNFDTPLTAALDAVEHDPSLGKADIVFVTDGECAVSQPVLDRLEELRQRVGVRVFGLVIGSNTHTRKMDWCDSVQTITDLTDVTQLEHIFQSLA